MNRAELARQLRETGVVRYGQVRLRGGATVDRYADIKKAYGYPRLLRAMAQLTLENFDQTVTCVAASGYSGIPLGVAVSFESGLPLALVRESEKHHGRSALIDGHVPAAHDTVAIVDDVFTSGSSLRQTAEALSAMSPQIEGCYVVVARGDVSQFALPVRHLLTLEDIV